MRRLGEDSNGVVEEMLRTFRAVKATGGDERDAMWAVLAEQLARRGRKDRRGRWSLFDEKARAIVESVCSEMSLTRGEFLSRQRARHLVRARWVAMRAMRDCGYSLPVIGAHTGRVSQAVSNGLARIGEFEELVEMAERVRVSPRVQSA